MGLTNSELVDVVLAARDRVAQGWTQGTEARTAEGNITCPGGADAASWCMAGAVMAVGCPWMVVQRAFDRSGILNAGLAFRLSMVGFNDSGDGSQAKAVGAFDELARWLKDTGWAPDES